MTTRNFSILLTVVLFTIFSNAYADPYRVWSDEVRSATKGLSICADAYRESLGHGRTAQEVKKYLTKANRTCAVLKMKFDTTMLTVRSNVNGIDGPLASYHRLVLKGFDEITPKANEDPLSYEADSTEIELLVQKMQLKLVALDGGW